MKEKNNLKYLFLIIYIAIIAIFMFFTLRSGEESTKDSSFITDIFLFILRVITFNKVDFDYEILHHITRKLVGHYGYNVITGVFGFLTIYKFKGIGKFCLIMPLILGLLIASTGELLQFIPANRGPSYIDILFNFLGESTGVFLVFVIIIYKNNKKTLTFDK